MDNEALAVYQSEVYGNQQLLLQHRDSETVKQNRDSDNDDDKEDQNENTQPFASWIHLTKYSILSNFKHVLQSIIQMDNHHFIVYNYTLYGTSSISTDSVHVHNGFYIYNIKENKWIKSAELKIENPVKEDRWKTPYIKYPHLVTNTALYNKDTKMLTIYEQESQQLIEYDIRNDTWNTTKYKPRLICNIGGAYGSSNTGGDLYTYNWSKSEQCVLVDDGYNANDKLQLHCFRVDRGYLQYVCDYFGETERTRVRGTKGKSNLNYFSMFTCMTQIIYIKSKKCFFVLDDRGGVLLKYSILNQVWNSVPDVILKYDQMRAVLCNDYRKNEYILFYGGYYNDDEDWSRHGIDGHHSVDIHVFNVETEKINKCKIKSPFDDAVHCGVIINEYDDKILLFIHGFIKLFCDLNKFNKSVIDLINLFVPTADYLYMLSIKGDIYKIEINQLIFTTFKGNKFQKYVKIVKELENKRQTRTLDITEYKQNQYDGIIAYISFLAFLDESSLSLLPPDKQQSNSKLKIDTKDPFKHIFNKTHWKQRYDDTKKAELHHRILMVIVSLQQYEPKMIAKYNNNDLQKLYENLEILNDLERRIFLLKYFMFVGNDLIQLNIDGIKSNDDDQKEQMYDFELYKIDFNDKDSIKNINTNINGVWNKYKKYVIEPWPTFGIDDPKLCEKYEFRGTVGKGRCSRIIEAIDKNDANQRIAIEIISNENLYNNEVDILSRVQHKNIVKFIGNVEYNKHYYILTDLCAGEQLSHRLERAYHTDDGWKIKEKKVKSWIKSILLMIQYLHSENIVIRDLKCTDFVETCLYDDFFDEGYKIDLILTDLKYAKIVNDNEQYDKDIVSVNDYISPELLMKNVSNKITGKTLKCCDVWNVGIITYMMLTGNHPFNDVINDIFILPKRELSISFKHFLSKLLVKNPEKRICVDNALNHPFITGADFIPEPWIFLTKYNEFSKGPKVIPSMIAVSNDQFILCNTFHGQWDSFFDSKTPQVYEGFHIYNISQNKWIKSKATNINEPATVGNKKIRPVDKLCPNTAIYNKKTNILTIYEQKSMKLIEYDLKNDIWNAQKYGKRLIYNPKEKISIHSEIEYLECSEQLVVVDDKIHIFSNNPYKHFICDCVNDDERKEINDDILDIEMLKPFVGTTQILYCKPEQSLFVLFYDGGGLFKYSILNKKWNRIKDVNVRYRGMRAMLCKHDKCILFYGGYEEIEDYKGWGYTEYIKSQNILIYDIQKEKIRKSEVQLPFEDENMYLGIKIDEYNDKILVLLDGFIRLFCGVINASNSILNLIRLFIPSECIYMLSTNGNLCKIELFKIESTL